MVALEGDAAFSGSEETMASVHPELRQKVFLNQWVGAPLMILFGVGFLWPVVSDLLVTRDFIWVHALVCSISLIFFWAAWYAWTSIRWYERVTWVVREVNPVPMRVFFRPGLDSVIEAELWPVDDSETEGILIRFLPPSWDVMQFDSTVVQAYVDPAPRGPVVFSTPAGLVWPLERGPRYTLPPSVAPSEKPESG